MSVVIKSKLVVEEIIDAEGNVLGEIKFNPNDTRIVNKLSKIIVDIQEILEKTKKIGDIPQINSEKLEKLEDFEESAEAFKKINDLLNLESEASSKIISDLSEVLGSETVELFTGGMLDLSTLYPLLDFIIPHIKKVREEKISEYINSSDVMD